MVRTITVCIVVLAIIGTWLYTCYDSRVMSDLSTANFTFILALLGIEGGVEGVKKYGEAKREIPPGVEKSPTK